MTVANPAILAPPSSPRGVTARQTWAAPAIILLLGILTRAPLLARPGFPPDMQQFLHWAHISAQRGLAHVYDEYEIAGRKHRWCNYPPAYLHVLRGLAAIYPSLSGRPFDAALIRDASIGHVAPETRIAWMLFKLPATLADLATAILLYLALRRRNLPRTAWVVGVVYAVNPAVLFNSAVWGQVDAIHTLWMLLSLDAAARRRPAAMSVWAALALCTKPQSLLLAPLWLAVLLCRFPTNDVASIVKRVIRALAAGAITTAALLAPFGLDALPGIRDAYTRAVGYYPVVHLNGFSAWFLANPINAPRLDQFATTYRRDDAPFMGGITPRDVGLCALAPAALFVFMRLRRRHCDDDSLRWAAFVLPLAFFVLPTQVHERYLFPAIALMAWGISPRACGWIAWLLVSAAAFANAAWSWPGPPDAPWISTLHAALYGSWIGTSCALMLVLLLLVKLVIGPKRRPL